MYRLQGKLKKEREVLMLHNTKRRETQEAERKRICIKLRKIKKWQMTGNA